MYKTCFLKRKLKNKNNLLLCKQTLENDECKTDIYEFKNEIEIAYIEVQWTAMWLFQSVELS
jgi:hypothetical protein